MKRSVAIVAAALVLGSARPAHAGITHVVRRGESLETIAKRAYGRAWKWVYLAGANNLPGKSARPGRRLRIPTARPYVVRHGDSLRSLARRFLGSPSRYVFLEWMNGIKDPRGLVPGKRILIPAWIRHQVLRGESLAGLARRFYRNHRLASWLRAYNGLGPGHVVPGTVIRIPLIDRSTDAAAVAARLSGKAAADRARRAAAAKAAADRARRAAAAKAAADRARRAAAAKAAADRARRAAAAKAAADRARRAAAAKAAADRARRAAERKAAADRARRAAAKKQAAERARRAAAASPKVATASSASPTDDPTGAVDAAARLYAHGDYRRTVDAIQAFLVHDLEPPRALEARARRLLAYALVALGRRGEALAQFQRVLALDPDLTLDPVRTSPKILRVFRQAKASAGRP